MPFFFQFFFYINELYNGWQKVAILKNQNLQYRPWQKLFFHLNGKVLAIPQLSNNG